MCNKFQNQYRIPSARRCGWDYSWNGWYFVTICTMHKKCFFGGIHGDIMVHNEIGKLVEYFWNQIPSHFSYVGLDEFIVMPNHIHGILTIQNPAQIDAEKPLVHRNDSKMADISPTAGSLPTIIRSFKSVCTKAINLDYPSSEFRWQTRFYDRVIRGNDELNRIRYYITTNPQKWTQDELCEQR